MADYQSATSLISTTSTGIITAIRQAKKKLDHVNIELDGKFWINVDKNELLRHDLFKGKQIDAQQKVLLEEVAQDNKLMDKVFNFISLRPRSIKEIKDYLVYRRELETEKVQQVINELLDRDFISDSRFTDWYLENRLANGVHGVNKVKAELAKKGVSKQIVEAALKEKQDAAGFIDETQQKISEYIDKVSRQIKFKDKYEFKRKLIARLQGRGFTYDQIQQSLKQQSIEIEEVE